MTPQLCNHDGRCSGVLTLDRGHLAPSIRCDECGADVAHFTAEPYHVNPKDVR